MGWKGKFIFLLIIYFSGFATAIYVLAPSPESMANGQTNQASVGSAGGEFTNQLNIAMHKFIPIAKKAAVKTGQYIQEKMNEKNQSSEQTDTQPVN